LPEAIIRTGPGGAKGAQAASGPYAGAHGTVERGRLGDDETVLGVKRRGRANAVVGGGDDDVAETSGIEPGDETRISNDIPGVKVGPDERRHGGPSGPAVLRANSASHRTLL
jgi:hypothetical protein